MDASKKLETSNSFFQIWPNPSLWPLHVDVWSIYWTHLTGSLPKPSPSPRAAARTPWSEQGDLTGHHQHQGYSPASPKTMLLVRWFYFVLQWFTMFPRPKGPKEKHCSFKSTGPGYLSSPMHLRRPFSSTQRVVWSPCWAPADWSKPPTEHGQQRS